MPHKKGGYFYCRYTYECPYTDAEGQRHVDNNNHAAMYSTAPLQDHIKLNKWYKDTFLPKAQAHIEKNYYGNVDRNGKGFTYDRFQSNFIKIISLNWTENPPTHDTGPLKGEIYGKKI
ncbi:hypothetical protein Hte_008293 [Hypoxylon texense]